MAKNIIEKHFDEVSTSYDQGKEKYSLYYSTLKKVLAEHIPNNSRVFEVGCGTGSLIYSLKPKQGYGVDISAEMIRIAKSKYNRKIMFSTKWPNIKFDYIFMSDVIEHLEEPNKIFKKIANLMSKESIFINTMANPIWEPLLMVWEKLGLKMPEGKHKRISFTEIERELNSVGLKVIKHDYKLLFPISIPFVTTFVNKYIEKFFKRFSFIEYLVAVRS